MGFAKKTRPIDIIEQIGSGDFLKKMKQSRPTKLGSEGHRAVKELTDEGKGYEPIRGRSLRQKMASEEANSMMKRTDLSESEKQTKMKEFIDKEREYRKVFQQELDDNEFKRNKMLKKSTDD